MPVLQLYDFVLNSIAEGDSIAVDALSRVSLQHNPEISDTEDEHLH